jgi:hypothetical protein
VTLTPCRHLTLAPWRHTWRDTVTFIQLDATSVVATAVVYFLLLHFWFVFAPIRCLRSLLCSINPVSISIRIRILR